MKTFGYIMAGLFGLILLSVILFTCNVISIGANHVTNSMENAVISYDDYQNIYNSATKINDDIATLRGTPENDKMFDQFSKAALINGKKQQLTRVIAEYNSKSEHIDKKWWKSDKLPLHLTTDHFSNYEDPIQVTKTK